MAELRWHGDSLLEELDDACAEGLLRAAVFFQTTHKAKLSVSNPRPHKTPSKPGEYPRLRTGFGRNAVMYEPTTKGEIKQTLTVKIGYLANAWYMALLEVKRRRKGLKDTLELIRQQLQALMVSKK